MGYSGPIPSTPSTPLAQEWHQCTDQNGYVYYFNASSGESRWEPPEWVEETGELVSQSVSQSVSELVSQSVSQSVS